jgi:hypothetical protein
MEDDYLVLCEVDHRRSEGLAECLVKNSRNIVDQNQGNHLDINTSWLRTDEAAFSREVNLPLKVFVPRNTI